MSHFTSIKTQIKNRDALVSRETLKTGCLPLIGRWIFLSLPVRYWEIGGMLLYARMNRSRYREPLRTPGIFTVERYLSACKTAPKSFICGENIDARISEKIYKN